ncbi:MULTISPECIES: hypothetical protein [Jannaschia]|nr:MULTISPECIES: hypothetical protein [unclassified Jannaschia]
MATIPVIVLLLLLLGGTLYMLRAAHTAAEQDRPTGGLGEGIAAETAKADVDAVKEKADEITSNG